MKLPIVRINMLHLYLGAAVIVLLLVVQWGWWKYNSNLLQSLDEERKGKIEEVTYLEERALWSREYVRIVQSLDFLTRGRLKPAQLRATSERLWVLSRRLHFDPLLVLAVVATESKGKPNALGKKRSGELSGAMGLMQIKQSTAVAIAKELGLENPENADLLQPDINVAAGSLYLIQLIVRQGGIMEGIMAYNLGPGAVYKGAPPPRKYINKVLSNYEALVRRFG